MTDVVILKRIPGLKPGAVVPMEPWLDNHVRAGNAKILPNEHGAWDGGETAPATPEILGGETTGVWADDDIDAPASDEEE